MATVTFYEKPGCINNTKQKTVLTTAGHILDVHNLLTEAWTPARLRPFFGNLPVSSWFNRTAPQVKSGEVNPDQLDEETALALMVEQPILIRRPLMQVGDRYAVGFDTAAIEQWIGLQPVAQEQSLSTDELTHQDLENCPRAAGQVTTGNCPT